MAKQEEKVINKFYGGIVRDDKSRIPGAGNNFEEIDIFANENFIIAEQIMTTDAMPASTEVYAYTSADDDKVYGYGKETAGNKVRIVEVSSGGSTNPGAFSTTFTSADATNLSYLPSDFMFFRTSETTQGYLYYTTKDSTTIILKRFDINAGTESTVGTLTDLDGSFDRIVFKIIFGELLVTNGQFMAKVDKDGVFTEQAFTLPNQWDAVDIVEVGVQGLILARRKNRLVNFAKGFWWDLTSSTQVDDEFDIPFGGPQWITKHKETIKILCAINGTARFYQMSGAFQGAIPIELPGIALDNIANDDTEVPISHAKMVNNKDNILYFGLNKDDKTGIYAIGQLDSNRPNALILSKRFDTSDYSLHTARGLYIQGPNFYGAFDDDGTADNTRCESSNSPDRSSNAIYETIILDDNDPTVDKQVEQAYITSYPLPASTDIDVSVAVDYGSFAAILRPDGTSFDNTGGLLGFFDVNQANVKVFQFKTQFTSNGVDSPKMTSLGFKFTPQDVSANK